MRVINLGFNQGSLLKRTVLHVAAFVVGSTALIGALSFVSVSIAKGVLAPSASASTSPSSSPAMTGAAAPGKLAPAKGRMQLKPQLNGRASRITGQDG
jgi:hypothetical protein